MTYSDKVNKSKDLRELIESLEDGDNLIVEYSKHPKEDPKQYKIKAYRSDYENKMSYSIWNILRGMKIDKINKRWYISFFVGTVLLYLIYGRAGP